MKWLTIPLFVLSCAVAWSQPAKPSRPDSLKNKLAAINDTRAKFRVLGQLIQYYRNVDLKQAMSYAAMGLSLSKKIESDSDVCTFHNYQAEISLNGGDFKKTMRYCDTALLIEKKYGYNNLIAKSLSDMGVAYEMQGDYIQSLNYFFSSMKFGEQAGNKELLALCYTNISSLYFDQNNYEKTIFYANKSLDASKNLKKYLYPSKALELIGSSYAQQNNMKDAQKYYYKALDIYVAHRDSMGIAIINYALATTFSKDYQKALTYSLKSQAIWDKIGPGNLYAISNMGNIGVTYGDWARDKRTGDAERKKLYIQAASYLGRAVNIAKQTNSKQNIMQLSDSLATIGAEMGNYKDAYANLVTHNKLNDSIYSQENKNKIASLEGKHEIELRDKQLKINKLEIQNEHRQRLFLYGGLFALVLIAGLIFYQNVQRKKSNTTLLTLNNELDEANKVKTRFFNILNHDLRSPVAGFVNFLQLQQEAPDLLDDAGRDAYSKKAVQMAENLLNNMEDLLLWSKGQMENFRPNIKQLPVDKLFEYIQAAATLSSNIQLNFEQQPGMRITTDEHYVKTIMFNLTNNAIKALGDKAQGEINWKAWQADGHQYLAITDNGPGAAHESFRPLYDGSAPIGIKNGLGLHIVRDLAKAIGCKVSVQSSPGAGAEIKLSFNPLNPGTAATL